MSPHRLSLGRGCIPAEPASVSPGKFILAPDTSSLALPVSHLPAHVVKEKPPKPRAAWLVQTLSNCFDRVHSVGDGRFLKCLLQPRRFDSKAAASSLLKQLASILRSGGRRIRRPARPSRINHPLQANPAQPNDEQAGTPRVFRESSMRVTRTPCSPRHRATPSRPSVRCQSQLCSRVSSRY